MERILALAITVCTVLVGSLGILAAGPEARTPQYDLPVGSPLHEEFEQPLARPWLDPEGKPLPFANEQEILDFLSSARIVSMKRVGEGMNQTRKVLLERDGLRMHAAFRDVKVDRQVPDPRNPAFLRNHRDDCVFELAAYRLSKLLGLSLVPPVVMREVDGKVGSLQAWVEKATMEKERRAAGIDPPDEWYWTSQMITMRLFDNLVANVDRHQGNLLIDSNWEIRLIDHTQAFRRFSELQNPELLVYCDREVWKRLRALDRNQIEEELGSILRDPEIKALGKRRDLIVKQLQQLIAQRGEDQILF